MITEFIIFYQDLVKMLGKGAYGTVEKRGNLAVKKFDHRGSLIQEFLAGRYLYGCDNIVKVVGVDFLKLELHMELHETTLANFLRNERESSGLSDSITNNQQVKYQILQDILIGLDHLHKRGLTHGDLKPGNILLSKNRACLGDLGFVSLGRYARVTRTTKTYCEKTIKQSAVHDLYSLGVVINQMFGSLPMKKQMSYDSAHRHITASVEDPQLRSVALRLTSAKHFTRPSAAEVLKELFNRESDIHLGKYPQSESSDDSERLLYKWMRQCARRYSLDRAYRGYKAVMCYLAEHQVPSDKYLFFMSVMAYILSAAFSSGKYREKEIMREFDGKYNTHDISNIVTALLTDEKVAAILLYPSQVVE